jgi:hypothetical protein
MEFASAITGFIELCSWAQSRGQERAPIQIPLYVAGRRVNLLLASSGCAPDCTRRPAPGVLRLGFGAWKTMHENCASAVANHSVSEISSRKDNQWFLEMVVPKRNWQRSAPNQLRSECGSESGRILFAKL